MTADPRALIAQARALLDASTEGPWQECGHDRGGCTCRQFWSVSGDVMVGVSLSASDESYTGGEGCTVDQAKANTRLIVFARNHLAQLVSLVEAGIRDTERLDWMIASEARCEVAPSEDYWVIATVDGEERLRQPVEGFYRTARGAIDAAMRVDASRSLPQEETPAP